MVTTNSYEEFISKLTSEDICWKTTDEVYEEYLKAEKNGEWRLEKNAFVRNVNDRLKMTVKRKMYAGRTCKVFIPRE